MSTLSALARSPRRTDDREPLALRPVSRRWRALAVVAAWSLVVGVIALWASAGGVGELTALPGALSSTGRLAGLLSSVLLLGQVLLMARIPWLERAFGQDGLVRWHRWTGFTSFVLMLAHVSLTTVGYAAGTTDGIVGTFTDLVANQPGMLLALAGTLALIAVVVTSLRLARNRLRYESWHLLHLYAYLGAGLALPHQLWTGQSFHSSKVATVFWWISWAAALLAVVSYRVAVPLWRSWRHRLVVEAVDTHQLGMRAATTVILRGRRLDALPVQAGQFFHWRFLSGPGWTRAHPYSLSAAPDGQTLRLTAMHVGDGSRALAQIVPGTPVLIEGPYGRLHKGVRSQRKVLLMGAGTGIAPLRALAEGLEQQRGDITVIHRVHCLDEALFHEEFDELADRFGTRVILVPGPRISRRDSWLPLAAAHRSDAEALVDLVPDLLVHDLYICGNPQWMAAVRRAAVEAGLPRERIHLEIFAY